MLILKNLPDAQTDDDLANKLGLPKVLAIAFEDLLFVHALDGEVIMEAWSRT